MDKEGVVLVKWRNGNDVANQATHLVEKAMREMGVEGHSNGPNSKGKTGKGGGEAKVADLKRMN